MSEPNGDVSSTPVSVEASLDAWIDLYQRRFPRTRANGRRALTALYALLEHPPPEGFTVRDVASRAGVGLDTVARVVQHLRWLGVLSVAGGGWVAERGGRPGHGVRFTYATHWPPRQPREGQSGAPGGHDGG